MSVKEVWKWLSQSCSISSTLGCIRSTVTCALATTWFLRPMSRLPFVFVSPLAFGENQIEGIFPWKWNCCSSFDFQIQYPCSGRHAKYSCWLVVCLWPHIFMLLPRVSKTLSPRWFEVRRTKRACTKVTSNRVPRYTLKIGELGIQWVICTCMSFSSSLCPPTAWNSDSCGVPEWVPWGSYWEACQILLLSCGVPLTPCFYAAASSQ